jgi:hypothetical protein
MGGLASRAPNKFHPMQVHSFEPYHKAKGYEKDDADLSDDQFESKSDIHQFKMKCYCF